jgi:hypothetical protein
MSAILFPLGVRLSTWIVLGVFLLFGVRDRRYWLAGAAWLTGFEAAYQVTSLATGHPLPGWGFMPFVFMAIGVTVVGFSASRNVRPSASMMSVVAVLWVVWVASGFHVNGPTSIHLDPAAEVLNEAAKTLWGVAYLWPLWKVSGGGFFEDPLRRGRQRAAAPATALHERASGSC